MYKCPKCKNFASMGPGICWKCGAKLQEEPTVLHLRLRPRAGPLRIRNHANVDVTGGYLGVIGGREQWTVTAQNHPHAVVSNLAIRFSLPDSAIGNYVVDDDRAVLTPFVCLPSSANFYWGQASTIQVTVEATVLGQRVVEHFTLTVLSPTLSVFSAQVSSSAVRTQLPPFSGADPERFTTSALSFGSSSPGHAGIAFTVQINLANPSLAGEITLTQIMRVNRQKVSELGQLSNMQSPDFVVDREFHYGFDSPIASSSSSSASAATASRSSSHSFDLSAFSSSSSSSNSLHSSNDSIGSKSSASYYSGSDDEDAPQEPLAVSAGQYNLTTEDSPSSRLGDNGNRRQTTRVTIDEEFRMYVMYRPTNGVWVALGEITWYWSAIAYYDIATNRFGYQPGPHAMANALLLPNLLFARFPLWNGNASDHLDEFG